MARSNFERCLPIVLRHEGGYVDHPRDPGGATNLGVTIGTLSGWLGRPATKAEVRALTVEAVTPIYRKNYWNAVRADAYQHGADLAVFDAAVNSGTGRALRWARAVKAANAVAFVNAYCDLRLGFLGRLGTWDAFGRGWSRRVADIRAQGIRMAARAHGQQPAVVLQREAAGQQRKATRDAAASAGTAGAGGAAATQAPEAAVTLDWPALIAMGGAGLIVAGAIAFLALRSINRRDAAKALTLEAERMDV
jgi:lysozyme family protein